MAFVPTCRGRTLPWNRVPRAGPGSCRTCSWTSSSPNCTGGCRPSCRPGTGCAACSRDLRALVRGPGIHGSTL